MYICRQKSRVICESWSISQGIPLRHTSSFWNKPSWHPFTIISHNISQRGHTCLSLRCNVILANFSPLACMTRMCECSLNTSRRAHCFDSCKICGEARAGHAIKSILKCRNVAQMCIDFVVRPAMLWWSVRFVAVWVGQARCPPTSLLQQTVALGFWRVVWSRHSSLF